MLRLWVEVVSSLRVPLGILGWLRAGILLVGVFDLKYWRSHGGRIHRVIFWVPCLEILGARIVIRIMSGD